MDLPNLVEIGQAIPDILQGLENLKWRLRRHLGWSSKVKTHPSHIYSDTA